MKKLVLLILILSGQLLVNAQPLITRNGYISFYSKTPLEDIKAENRQVNAVIDPSTKKIAFVLLMKGFLFPKALMQEHLNENYVESDKYPKASFSGNYTGDVDQTKEGNYPIMVTGNLMLHGTTRTIDVPATMEVKEGKLISRTTFIINPTDYNIKIPGLVRDKIAEQLVVTVKTDHNFFK
jgi:hypothetical protein